MTCYLSPIKAIPLAKSVLRRPSVSVGSKRITFPVELESGSYLELNSPVDCKVYGPNGELKVEAKPEGEIPALEAGENQVSFRCETNEGTHARVTVTVISEGTPIQ